MKLNKEFLIHNTGDESILVPTGNAEFSGVVRGNNTLGAILELLKTDATEAEIIAAMKARFEAPEGDIERDVAKVVSELQKIGALDE
jgi:hypothetical protein